VADCVLLLSAFWIRAAEAKLLAGAEDSAAAAGALCLFTVTDEAASDLDWGRAELHWVEEEAVSVIALICIIPPCNFQIDPPHTAYRQDYPCCSMFFLVRNGQLSLGSVDQVTCGTCVLNRSSEMGFARSRFCVFVHWLRRNEGRSGLAAEIIAADRLDVAGVAWHADWRQR
jgi:hypothetical protein